MNIQLKFEKMNLVLTNKTKKNEVADSIDFVDRLIKQRTLKSLMRMYNKEISKFFGFEFVSILFHDKEKDQLYTITFGDEDELKYELDQRRKRAKSDNELAFIDALENMKDMELSQNHMIFFPISTGITSQVFKT